MFAGHVGIGLALGRLERGTNVALFVGAALWLDAVLWTGVLLGWEAARIGPDFAHTHQPVFDFPWSHGALAALGWSLLLGALAALGRWRVAGLVAAAVVSHWALDAVVHSPGLPLAGPGSPVVGLGLWQQLPLALLIETALVVAGVALFVRGSRLPRGRRVGIALLALALAVFTVAGMTLAPPPPSATAMAASSLATLVAVVVLFAWLGRPGRP